MDATSHKKEHELTSELFIYYYALEGERGCLAEQSQLATSLESPG